MQIFQAGSCLPPSKLETERRAAWHPSPVPADACGVRSGLFKGIPSVRIILPLCSLPIQSFVRRHEELGDIRKGSEDWNPPQLRVSRTKSGRRIRGGCCEAEGMHTPSPREGERGHLAPRVCCLRPLPSPTREKVSPKDVASRQSCTALPARQPQLPGEGQKPLLPGERMLGDGSCPGSHRDHANTLARRKVMPNRDAPATPKTLLKKYLQ